MSFRILLLEDHEGGRYVMRQALIALGHECKAVSSTDAALRAVEAFQAEAIVYEWFTRDGKRIGLSRRFRAVSRDDGLLIIVLSAADEPPDFRDRETIDAYLTKPLRAAELEAALRLVRHRRAVSEAQGDLT